MVKLVDQSSALSDGGLKTSGNLTDSSQWAGQRWDVLGSFAEGKASSGLSFDGIGLLATEESDAIVFVALGIATGDGKSAASQSAAVGLSVVGELVEEVEEIVGVLPGGIESDGEGDTGVSGGDVLETLEELSVSVGGFDELQWFSSGLVVGLNEGGEVSVSRGIDTDTDGYRRGRGLDAGVGRHELSRSVKAGEVKQARWSCGSSETI